MTKKETIELMAILSAFYGAGKGNPEVMAEGWYMILQPYDFEIAKKAVLNYAKNDTREYGTFPTVGNIVKEIEAEMRRTQAPINEIIRAISYGWDYSQLSSEAMTTITEEHYNEWLSMDAEKFSANANTLAQSLRENRMKLLEVKK